MGGFQSLRNFDAFPRAEEHLLQKTHSGAIVSIVGIVVMVTLFVHELQYYLTTYTVHQMSVDVKRGENLPIHINITFPSLPCEVLSVDAIDMSRKHEVDLDTNIWKANCSICSKLTKILDKIQLLLPVIELRTTSHFLSIVLIITVLFCLILKPTIIFKCN